MFSVYQARRDPLKQRIANLKIKHDGTYNSGGYLRQGVTATDDPRTSPGAVHPLVCTHPDTGRPMLYLGRRRNAYLVGLELAESEALLDELWDFVARPEFAWEHAWQVCDLVLWDNRGTMHRHDPFDAASRRIMHRTQIKGSAAPVRSLAPQALVPATLWRGPRPFRLRDHALPRALCSTRAQVA